MAENPRIDPPMRQSRPYSANVLKNKMSMAENGVIVSALEAPLHELYYEDAQQTTT